MAQTVEREENVFWADKLAQKVMEQKGKKKQYVVASGITPSGTVHIGNLREEMTAQIVARALQDNGVKVRYIHSWDDFDRFRKVPGNMPQNVKDNFEKFIGMPVCKVPDPFECHTSYGEHFEKEFEGNVKDLGIVPEYIYQHKKWMSCDYAEGVKVALQKKEWIKQILAKFKSAKKEELGGDTKKEYWPCEVYCEKCWMDFTEITSYDGEYQISYHCTKCGHKSSFDFREVGNIKLKWRIDWPMRWKYEGVDFEGAGKEHGSAGGSRDTAVIIAKEIFEFEAPVYQMYDFVLGTGGKGKMSGSKGNVISPADMKKIYIPQVFRYFYVGNKPVKEFIIPFDDGVNKVYEDFYRVEKIYFGKEKAESETKKVHWKRVYEISCPGKTPEKMPIQIQFFQLVRLSEFYDYEKSLEELRKSGAIHGKLSKDDDERLHALFNSAKHWKQSRKDENVELTDSHKAALKELMRELENEYTQDEWTNIIFDIAKRTVGPKEFFMAAYIALFGKTSGPKLAEFIKSVGEKEVRKRLEQALAG